MNECVTWVPNGFKRGLWNFENVAPEVEGDGGGWWMGRWRGGHGALVWLVVEKKIICHCPNRCLQDKIDHIGQRL